MLCTYFALTSANKAVLFFFTFEIPDFLKDKRGTTFYILELNKVDASAE